MYMPRNTIGKQRSTLQKAAVLNQVIAMFSLAIEGRRRFVIGDDLNQMDNFSTPDHVEALRLMNLAARLGLPNAYESRKVASQSYREGKFDLVRMKRFGLSSLLEGKHEGKVTSGH